MTILSRLRTRLTDGTETSVYLGRALGEIALIVIGILIAIQVDSWNQNRQERQQEQQYIQSLLEDVRFKPPEFLALVNQELTFAYSVNRVMNLQIEDGQSLVALLEYYLDSF